MSEAPKIPGLPNVAKARLGSALPGGPHPDADQLTAFVEQRLAAQERELVLTHLSACIDCREIVALAATEEPLVSATIVSGEKKSFRWNFMKWGVGVATAAVIVSAVLILQPQKAVQQREEAHTFYGDSEKPQEAPAPQTSKDAETASATKPAATNEASPNAKTDAGLLADSKESKAEERIATKNPHPGRDQAAVNAYVTPKTSGYGTGMGVSGGVIAGAAGGPAVGYGAGIGSSKPVPSAPAPPPPPQSNERSKDAHEVVTLDATAPAEADSISKSKMAESERREAEHRQSLQMTPASNLKTMRANPAAQSAPTSAPQSAPAAAQNAPTAGVQKKMEPIEGQRSRSDNFAIEGGSAEAADIKSGVIQKPNFVARLRNGKLEVGQDGKWIASSLSTQFAPSAQLSTYAALGDTIWVGGKGGDIYVSTDGAKTWTTIKGGWKGDITAITRRDLSRAEIKTSNGETWSTEDAGKNWKRK